MSQQIFTHGETSGSFQFPHSLCYFQVSKVNTSVRYDIFTHSYHTYYDCFPVSMNYDCKQTMLKSNIKNLQCVSTLEYLQQSN